MSEQQPEKPMNEKKVIEDWELLFPSPEEAQTIGSVAKQLIKSGLGKRSGESDLQFCLRIQYCLAKDIPLCFVNSTYPIEGKIGEMVDLKMWRFKKACPQAEFIVQMCNPTKMIKIGRTSPDNNWVKVEWTVEKAKKLRLYSSKKAQWTDNTQSMLNARCNGQLVDILGGLESAGVGYLSTPEINNIGVDVELPAELEETTVPETTTNWAEQPKVMAEAKAKNIEIEKKAAKAASIAKGLATRKRNAEIKRAEEARKLPSLPLTDEMINAMEPDWDTLPAPQKADNLLSLPTEMNEE